MAKKRIKHFQSKAATVLSVAMLSGSLAGPILVQPQKVNASAESDMKGRFKRVKATKLNKPIPKHIKEFHDSFTPQQLPEFGSYNGKMADGGADAFNDGKFLSDGMVSYCMSINKYAPKDGSHHDTEYQVMGPVFRKILENGYPYSSAKHIGAGDDWKAAFQATQLAVWRQNSEWEKDWWAADHKPISLNKFKPARGPKSWTSLKEQAKVIKLAKKIFNEATKDAKKKSFDLRGVDTRDLDGISINKLSEKIENNYVDEYTTSRGHAWYIARLRVKTRGDVNKLKAVITAPDDVIVTQGGTVLKTGSAVSTTEDVIIRIPLLNEVRHVKFGVTGDVPGKHHEEMDTGSDAEKATGAQFNVVGSQNALVEVMPKFKEIETPPEDNSTTDDTSTNAEITLDVPPYSTITVHKTGENDGGKNDIGNITFQLIDANSGEVVRTGNTGADGKVTFDYLKPDYDYIIKEITTDSEHDLNTNIFPVHAEAGKTSEVNVKNTEKEDKPIVRSYSYETDSDKTHGSRVVDAKDTDLTDDVELNNVDAKHNYRVVDQVYDRETGEKLKNTDGSNASVYEDVSAADVNTSNGKDRGELHVKLRHPHLNLKGLQGHKIYTKVQVFRNHTSGSNVEGSGSNDFDLAHDGDLVAEEKDAANDVNQQLLVLKPKITSKAFAYDKYKVLNPYSSSQLTDHLHVTGLVVGHKYTMHIQLREPDGTDKGKAYIDPKTGQPVVQDYTFVATDPEMDIKMDYPIFSTVDQHGKKLVTFANITPAEDNDDQLGYHNEIADKDETVRVTKPKLGTQALMERKTHTPNPMRKARLYDEVKVTDVAPDEPLELGAVASDQNGNLLLYNENGVNYNLMGKIHFTPVSHHDDWNGNDQDPDVYDVEVPLMKVKDQTGAISLKDPITRQSINKLRAVNSGEIDADPIGSAKTQTGVNDPTWKEGSDTPYFIDTRDLAGKTFTLFEDLWEVPDKPMASEADTSNKEQQIHVRNPHIISKAIINDKSVSNPNSMSKIRDKVQWSDVEPGEELEIDATAVDPETGKNLQIRHSDDTTQVSNLRGIIRFVPSKESGTTIVPLEFTKVIDSDVDTQNRAKALDPKDLVPQTDSKNQDKSNSSSTDKKMFKGNDIVQIAQKLHPDNSAAYDRQQAVVKAEMDKAITPNNPASTEDPVDMNDHKYDVDTLNLRGQKINLVEDLITSAESISPTVVASDADVNNMNQQVRVTNPQIKSIQTIDDKRLYAINRDNLTEKVPIIDTVQFTDLAPDEEATLQAVEMNVDQKRPVVINGKFLTGQRTIKPKRSDGQVEIYFNPQTKEPYAYMTNIMLDKDNHITNKAYLAQLHQNQKQDESANSDANEGDETNHAATSPSSELGSNTQKSNSDSNTNDQKNENKHSNTSTDSALWQSVIDTSGSYYGTDDISSRDDTDAYDIRIKDLASQDKMETMTWNAFETLLNPNGEIIAEDKNYDDKDQTIQIKSDVDKPDTGTPGNSGNGGGGGNNTINTGGNKQDNHQDQNVNAGNGSNMGNGNGATVNINNYADGAGSGSGTGTGPIGGQGTGTGAGIGTGARPNLPYISGGLVDNGYPTTSSSPSVGYSHPVTSSPNTTVDTNEVPNSSPNDSGYTVDSRRNTSASAEVANSTPNGSGSSESPHYAQTGGTNKYGGFWGSVTDFFKSTIGKLFK